MLAIGLCEGIFFDWCHLIEGEIMKIYMLVLVIVAAAMASSSNAYAGKSGSGSSRSASSGAGTGAASSSKGVSGYVKKDGNYVAPHQRSTRDSTTDNNWTTKPNTNPYTGKEGSKVIPPSLGR
jgi:hypothetical protein